MAKTYVFFVGYCVALLMCVVADGNAQEADATKKRIAKLLADIQRVDGYQEISSENSQVVIVTPAIEAIVDSGPRKLNDLMLAMQIDEISFDAFARCYSACDQIIHAANPDLRVRWYGGSATVKINGETRITASGAYLDEIAFRKEVVADIVAKTALVLKMKSTNGERFNQT